MYPDGEPSLTLIWVMFLGLGVLGLFLSLLRWWASVPVVAVLALYAAVLLDDLYAADLYPVYTANKPGFVPSASLAISLGLLLPLFGIMIRAERWVKQNDRPTK